MASDTSKWKTAGIKLELSDYWHLALDRSGTDNTQNKMANLSTFKWYDKDREKILRNFESILGFSSDVLEPEIISTVDQIIQFIRRPILEEDEIHPTIMALQVEWSEPISKLVTDLKIALN